MRDDDGHLVEMQREVSARNVAEAALMRRALLVALIDSTSPRQFEAASLVRIAGALERIATALEQPRPVTVSREVSEAARAELQRRGLSPPSASSPPQPKATKPKPRAPGKVVPLKRRTDDESPRTA